MPDDKTIVTRVTRGPRTRRSRRASRGDRGLLPSRLGGAAGDRGDSAPAQRRPRDRQVGARSTGASTVELRVDLRDRWEDGELRGTALQALIADAGVPADRVEVVVSDGWLTLKGEVKDQSASDAAFAAVSELPGVGGITNEIRVITAGIDG